MHVVHLHHVELAEPVCASRISELSCCSARDFTSLYALECWIILRVFSASCAGDVTLKIMLDPSSVTSYVSIGGVNEPEIGQRKVEHEIRLKDGEVNLLGGMLEHTDTKSLSGIPGLSQIPIVKYSSPKRILR